MAKASMQWSAALVLQLLAFGAQAQYCGYWTDAQGRPVRDGSGKCIRAASWSADMPQSGCDAMPDRVVLLPGPDGKAGAVIVQSKQGQQFINRAYGGLTVDRGGHQRTSAEDAAAVQARYAAVLQVQPQRPVALMVQFVSGSATELTPESRLLIEELKTLLKTRKAPEITVIGHTDRVGALDANDRLSLKRAESVKNILVAASIKPELIDVAGRGEREPLVPTSDEWPSPEIVGSRSMFAETEHESDCAMHIDFKGLMREHLLFKKALEEDVQAGKMVDIEKLKNPTISALGSWIAGIRTLFDTVPEYMALSDRNRDFHLLSAAIVASLQKNRLPNMAHSCRGIAMYESSAMDVAVALRALERTHLRNKR